MVKKLCVFTILVAMSFCITSSAFAQVQTHGFILFRTIAASGVNSNYTTRVERYGINFTEKVNDEFDWLTEIYIHPQMADARARLYMESAYLNWNLSNRLPWDFRVRIGKGRNYTYGIAPSYGNRRTSDYTLYSEAFTQLRVSGFQTFSQFGNIQLAVALLNPYALRSRTLPDFAIGDNIPIPICDRDNDNSTIQRVGISGRLGYKTDMYNVGASMYMSETGSQDDNDHSRLGLDGELTLDNGIMGQAQFTIAKTNGIDHNGGEVLVGWEPGKAGLYARYGMLTYDDDTMYDLNQIMLSGVYKIHPRIHLRLEALLNGEDGKDVQADDINNDVIFFETLFAW